MLLKRPGGVFLFDKIFLILNRDGVRKPSFLKFFLKLKGIFIKLPQVKGNGSVGNVFGFDDNLTRALFNITGIE